MSHRLFAQLAFERALGNAAIEALGRVPGGGVGLSVAELTGRALTK
jgi:hypothetical protein